MSPGPAAAHWRRRAQPLLGTLVEVGIRAAGGDGAVAFEAAFAELRQVQRELSRFEADSDVSRFHGLRRGEPMVMRRAMREVLVAAGQLRTATSGRFDISLSSAPEGWRCCGDELRKVDASARLDLGGIGKGYAVDRAIEALEAEGCSAGWINAGGDLRVFGDADLPLRLRNEDTGGVRDFAALREGAFATSRFHPEARSLLARSAGAAAASSHVSVAAPLCMWADALTKVVALSGNAADPLLARYDAIAWIH